MHTFTARYVIVAVAGILGLSVAGQLQAQQAPATSPVAAATRPGVDATKTMQFTFVNAQISVILNEMATRFGFIIVQPAVPVPGYVTIQVPNPVNADEAVHLLNNILVPLGYSTLETYTTATPGVQGSQHTILRVATLPEIKKSLIPVFEANTPTNVPMTDNYVTYVIPLKNLDAVRLRNDLSPILSADADVAVNAGANALIVTDTSAKIRRLIEIVEKLDHAPATMVMRQVELQRSNAADTAGIINSLFDPANTGQPSIQDVGGVQATPGRGTGGAHRARGGARGG